MIPDWLYRKCEITEDELYNIRKELIPHLKDLCPGIATLPPQLYSIKIEDLKKYSPTLCNFLQRLNLLDRWTFACFLLGNNNLENKWKIHVDDPLLNRCFALNIPLMYCRDTYTVWYDVKDRKKSNEVKINSQLDKLSDAYPGPEYFTPDQCVEIGRLEASQCAFVNITVPHVPEINHNKLRINLSLRFWPELFDYLDK